MAHDEWALKFKTKGTELRNIRGKYYLYRVSSKWDKERKVTKKITHEMVGRITEKEGLIPRGTKVTRTRKELPKELKSISVKEYGATSQLQAMNEDLITELKNHFPTNWQELFVIAANRLLYQSPLKNMAMLYEESFISEQYPDLDLNKNDLTALIHKIGEDREKVTKFMNKFVDGSEHLVFDITDTVSQSKKVKMSAKGYNSHYNFDPQVNLFYMFSTDKQAPVFYRVFPGNISGMKALDLSIKESGIKNALVIGDKGFCSESNINQLENISLNYILPLKRDSNYLDYQRLQSRAYKEAFDGYFMHYGRPVFYYTISNYSLLLSSCKPDSIKPHEAYLYKQNGQWLIEITGSAIEITNKAIVTAITKLSSTISTSPSGCSKVTDKILAQELRNFLIKNKIGGINFDEDRKIVIFSDNRLRFEEETGYLTRIESECEGYSIEGYQDKQLSFGTIGMITNMISTDPKSIYESFKTRMEVETVFDTYKNLLEADRSYMQSDQSINGWVFINHLAVMMYYKLLNLLKSKDLISKISPSDALLQLMRVNKVKINGDWHLAEINSKFMKTFTNLGLLVT